METWSERCNSLFICTHDMNQKPKVLKKYIKGDYKPPKTPQKPPKQQQGLKRG